MITVHHLNNSRSQRVLWLLEELDLEYQVKRYERDPNHAASWFSQGLRHRGIETGFLRLWKLLFCYFPKKRFLKLIECCADCQFLCCFEKTRLKEIFKFHF